MINFEPPPADMDFEPASTILSCVAEQTIVQTILEGTNCSEGQECSPESLRFIRYLLSTSSCDRSGYLPNFKNMESVRKLARKYIINAGGPGFALTKMLDVMA